MSSKSKALDWAKASPRQKKNWLEKDRSTAESWAKKKAGKKEKLSSFAKSIGLARGRYFCNRCEGQTHNVDWEGKCKSCSN